MARIFEIPLTAYPQRFAIPLGAATYTLTFVWRDVGKYRQNVGTWILDIADANGVPMVCGIPLVAGCDLLAPFDYLNFGGELWASTEGSDAAPGFVDLGTRSHVYFVMWEPYERKQLRPA